LKAANGRHCVMCHAHGKFFSFMFFSADKTQSRLCREVIEGGD
jgi:hypothetical protein